MKILQFLTIAATTIFGQTNNSGTDFSLKYRVSVSSFGDTVYNFTAKNSGKGSLSWIDFGIDLLEGRTDSGTDFSVVDSVTAQVLPGVSFSAPAGWTTNVSYVDEEPVGILEWMSKGGVAAIPPGGSLSGFRVTIPKGMKTNISRCFFTFISDNNIRHVSTVKPDVPLPPSTFVVVPSVSGSGKVSLVPDQPTYTLNSSVTLTPTPAAGYTFAGWSGDTTATSSTLSLKVNRNRFPTANFRLGTSVPKCSLTVTARDETPTDKTCSRLRVIVKNSGKVPASLGSFQFFYSPTAGKTSALETWYVPNCTGSLTKINQKDAISYKCKGVVLQPGASYPDVSGNGANFGLHNTDWTARNKALDWSWTGLSGTFSVTTKIVVQDSTGANIYGSAP